MKQTATAQTAAPITHMDALHAPMSRSVKRLVDAIRQPFLSFSGDLSGLTVRRGELAPKFMKAYNAWAGETSGSFPVFCQVLDPSIGPTREEYRAHKSFQAADYLRRLVNQQNRPARDANAARPSTPMDAVARLLKTITPLIGADEITKLHEALKRELHWSDRQVTQLNTRVETVEPLAQLRAPKGSTIAMPPLRIVMNRHVPTPTEQPAQVAAHG
jgi:hypothetical protein